MSPTRGRILRAGAVALPWAPSLRAALGLSLGALATALGAMVRVPVPGTPVPVTLQTLGAFVAGGLLGARRGAGSQAIYLGLGVLGLPLFVGGAAGHAWLLGPTGGYLWGFIVAAAFVGWAAPQGGIWLLAGLVAGQAAILALGSLQLALVLDLDLSEALRAGVFPFLAGDALKVAWAWAAICGGRQLVHRRAPLR